MRLADRDPVPVCLGLDGLCVGGESGAIDRGLGEDEQVDADRCRGELSGPR
jgi:hypothetical protein